MEQSFEEMGLPARILEFTSEEGRGYNVEATLHGSGGEKHLWVTAHLDSLTPHLESVGIAGANDNASGLTLLLMTARVLKHTVHFVAYDLEERDLVGSRDYVSTVVDSVQEREGRGPSSATSTPTWSATRRTNGTRSSRPATYQGPSTRLSHRPRKLSILRSLSSKAARRALRGIPTKSLSGRLACQRYC
jgi:hypothetical protein